LFLTGSNEGDPQSMEDEENNHTIVTYENDERVSAVRSEKDILRALAEERKLSHMQRSATLPELNKLLPGADLLAGARPELAAPLLSYALTPAKLSKSAVPAHIELAKWHLYKRNPILLKGAAGKEGEEDTWLGKDEGRENTGLGMRSHSASTLIVQAPSVGERGLIEDIRGHSADSTSRQQPQQQRRMSPLKHAATPSPERSRCVTKLLCPLL
jgi:hypothetical protein